MTVEEILIGVLLDTFKSLFGGAIKGIWARASSTKPSDVLYSSMTEALRTVLVDEYIIQALGTQGVAAFLVTPEAKSVMRHLIMDKLAGQSENQNGLVKEEFLAAYRLHVRNTDAADRVFCAVDKACQTGLKAPHVARLVSTPGLRDILQYQVLSNELGALRKNIALLTSVSQPSLTHILAFEEALLRQVEEKHSKIKPPHLDGVRRVSVDDLFVPPNLLPMRASQGDQPKITYEQFVPEIQRTVILGNPGGGKSTLCLKLCHDLAIHYDEQPLPGRKLTPIIVVLREYGAAKKEKSCSILEYLELLSSGTYQLVAPPRAFEYLLLNGRLLVIFDGLDELLDNAYRQEITEDVELFCRLYPSVPVVVTSRLVGYEQAPLDESRFESYRLGDFDGKQISSYVTKWFALDPDLGPDEQARHVQSFIEESESVPDLVGNPLMLALMCTIYRGENYLPRNRPDVYEKCSTMLFERWDKSRGINVPLPLESRVSPLVKYLAFWIFSDDVLQAGVTERQLVREATKYLSKWFEDPLEVEHTAQEFIRFCRGRAWVFTETGSTKDDEGLYQFTHPTFLEYFAAAHLVRANDTPKEIAEVLLPRIANREWDMVAHLAFQIRNRTSEEAGETLLRILLESAAGNMKGTVNLLSFAARCLTFMSIPQSLVREITVHCLDRCLSPEPSGTSDEDALSLRRMNTETIGALLCASEDNRATVADAIERHLVQTSKSGASQERVRALEVAIELPWAYAYVQRGPMNSRDYHDWLDLSNRMRLTCRSDLLAASEDSLFLSSVALSSGYATVQDVVVWHGIEALFQEPQLLALIGRVSPIAPGLAVRFSIILADEKPSPEAIRSSISTLGSLGRILESQPLLSPQAIKNLARRVYGVGGAANRSQYFNAEVLAELQAEPDAAFGLLAVLIARAKAYSAHVTPDMRLGAVSRLFSPIMRAHGSQSSLARAEHEFDRWHFTPQQRGYVLTWIKSKEKSSLAAGLSTLFPSPA